MGVIDKVIELFKGKTEITLSEMTFKDLESNMCYKILAIESAINLISKTVALAEFKTFEKGKEVRNKEYYKFNVNPNNSNSGYEFWRKVVRKLIYENETLIYKDSSGKFILADTFTREQKNIDSYIYKDIAVSNYKYEKVCQEEEVIYLTWDNKEMVKIINSVYDDYQELIQASKMGYLNNKYIKGILNIDSKFSQKDKNIETITEHYSNELNKVLKAKNSAVMPLQEGLEWKNLNEDKGKGAVDKFSDTRQFINDVFDYVAMALNIPPAILKFSVVESDKLINDYMTFCIKPITDVISDELNRKVYSEKQFIERTYVKVDISTIRVTELKDIAYGLDVLTRTGSNTIDDNLTALGREPIGDEIGQTRFVTKNYQPAEQMIKDSKVAKEENNGKGEGS